MKKSIIILFSVVLLAVITVIAVNANANRDIAGYAVPQLGQECKADAAHADGNRVLFRGFVQLGDDVANSSALLELELTAQIVWDETTGKHQLADPRLVISPIGCRQLSKGKELVTETKLSANYHFGTQPNESYHQTMAAGYAKILMKSGNIAMNSIASADMTHSVSSADNLRRAENDCMVMLDYNIMEHYYDEWYVIEFTLLSDKEGYFTVY